MHVETYLKEWASKYRSDLTADILPFWFKHGLDRINGGVYTCLDSEGEIMDTTKSVWFQGRFAFICAYAYNHIEQNPVQHNLNDYKILNGFQLPKCLLTLLRNIVLTQTEECFLKCRQQVFLFEKDDMFSLKHLQPSRWQSMHLLPVIIRMLTKP